MDARSGGGEGDVGGDETGDDRDAEGPLGEPLQLEALARSRGMAVAAGSALPVTIKALEDWSRDLEQRGLMLVPISATVDRPTEG